MRHVAPLGSVAAFALVATLSGCTREPLASTACPSYVDYPSIAAAAADADVVVHGTITTASPDAVELDVRGSATGDVEAGSTITVTAAADCDNLDATVGDEVIAVLVDGGSGYTPINPKQGLSAYSETQFASLKGGDGGRST